MTEPKTFRDIYSNTEYAIKVLKSPYRWLKKYCEAIPSVVFKYLYEGYVPTPDEYKNEVYEYMHHFSMLDYGVYNKNAQTPEEKAFHDFGFLVNPMTKRSEVTKVAEDHPYVELRGKIYYLTLFDSPNMVYINMLTHDFNAMASRIFWLVNHAGVSQEDKEKSEMYLKFCRPVYLSWYEAHKHIANHDYDPVTMYLVSTKETLCKWIPQKYEYTDENGNHFTKWVEAPGERLEWFCDYVYQHRYEKYTKDEYILKTMDMFVALQEYCKATPLCVRQYLDEEDYIPNFEKWKEIEAYFDGINYLMYRAGHHFEFLKDPKLEYEDVKKLKELYVYVAQVGNDRSQTKLGDDHPSYVSSDGTTLYYKMFETPALAWRDYLGHDINANMSRIYYYCKANETSPNPKRDEVVKFCKPIFRAWYEGTKLIAEKSKDFHDYYQVSYDKQNEEFVLKKHSVKPYTYTIHHTKTDMYDSYETKTMFYKVNSEVVDKLKP